VKAFQSGLCITLAVLGLKVVGLAQHKPNPTPKATNSVIQKPVWNVRQALGILCGEVGVSMTLSPKVTGKVHLGLEPAPFEDQLLTILHEVHATYRVQAGVYQIYPKSDRSLDQSHYTLVDPVDSRGLPSWVEDKQFLYRITGQLVVKVRKTDGVIVANTILPR